MGGNIYEELIRDLAVAKAALRTRIPLREKATILRRGCEIILMQEFCA